MTSIFDEIAFIDKFSIIYEAFNINNFLGDFFLPLIPQSFKMNIIFSNFEY
jgi:hypothetical protein